MIGVNEEGIPKVWLHEKFSQRFPDLSKIDQNLNESDFITKIIEVIEEHIIYSDGQENFY